jgi:hypothetical protein
MMPKEIDGVTARMAVHNIASTVVKIEPDESGRWPSWRVAVAILGSTYRFGPFATSWEAKALVDRLTR